MLMSSLPALLKRWSPPSPATKTLLACAAGLTLAFVVLCGLLAAEANRDAERLADVMAARLAAVVEQDVARSVELFDHTLQTAIELFQSPATAGLSPEQRNRVLFAAAARDRYVAFANVLDENGDVTAGLPVDEHATNWSSRDYFSALRRNEANGIYIGRPFATTQEEYAGITISRRVSGADGKFAGVVVLGVRVAYFRDLFGRLGLGPAGSVTLLRDDGTVLMRLPFDRNDVGRIVDATAPSAEFLRTGTSSFAATDPSDHVQRQFAFRRIGTLPLIVSVGIADEEIGAGWRTRVLLISLAGAGLAAAAGLVIARLLQELRLRHAAEQSGQEKSRYLTTLSHELRTPLQGVLGYADQLTRDGGLTAAQSRQVAEIVAAGKHMRGVVNEVLDYARIEARGPAPHMSRIDMRAVCEECLGLIDPGAKARKLKTSLTVASGAPGQFVTDGVQLRQILMNFLSNAVKYTPRGSIELRLSGTEEHLRIEVADTGIGIPEGRRHRLFKEYERFGADATGIEGTGLGLAIAQRLVMRMGGHLGYRANPGGGSVFWLELPSGVAEEPVAAPEATTTPVARQLRILVADDTEIARCVTVSFLEQAGHTATEAHDGVEAVRLATTDDFDLVLMDMRMPHMDGLEATRRIRALPGTRGQVPVVAMTANALDQHAEECRRAGMVEHLAKPVTQAELLAVVDRVAAASPRVELPVVDVDVMAQLASCMSPDNLQWSLNSLRQRIEALVARLGDDDPCAEEDTLGGQAHETAGSAGTLGFVRLSAAASCLDRAIATDPALAPKLVQEVLREANAALAKLHRPQMAGSKLFALGGEG
jgi:signal transduction histidine kinase/DNA-binding response OmpR family regulator